MTAPEKLTRGDNILVLRHGSKIEITGIQFSALENLRKGQPEVFEARITSTPSYFGGFYDMDIRIDELNLDIKRLSIRRDLLIVRTFTKQVNKGMSM